MNGCKISVGQLPLKNNILILLCFCSLCLFSCNNRGKQKTHSVEAIDSSIPVDQNAKPLPADFMEFYKKFHSDSSYQMQHISFPLTGMPDNADPQDMKENEFYFTADQWKLQKICDPKLNNTSYINLADLLIEERIIEKEHNLMVIRRFSKKTNGWILIYYAGLNKYRKAED